MSRNTSSAHDNLSYYDKLVQTGAIGSLKRDILLEASADLWFVDHVRSYFARDNGGSVTDVTPCTVRLIRELVAADLARLATWGDGWGACFRPRQPNRPTVGAVGYPRLSLFANQVACKRQKPGETIIWIHEAFNHIKRKVVEAAKAPHGKYQQQCHPGCRVLEKQ